MQQVSVALKVTRAHKEFKVQQVSVDLKVTKEPLESAVLQALKAQLVPEMTQISVSSMFAVMLEAVTKVAPAIQEKAELNPPETLTTRLGTTPVSTFIPHLIGAR